MELGRTCHRVVRRVVRFRPYSTSSGKGGLNGSTRGAAASSRVQATIRYAANAYRSYAAGCRVAVVVAFEFASGADRRLVVGVVVKLETITEVPGQRALDAGRVSK